MSKAGITFNAISEALDDAMAAMHKDLIPPNWAARKKAGDHYTFGLCYGAAAALRQLSKIFREQNPDIPELKTCKAEAGDDHHYWTVDKKTGEIHDPTAAQFAHGQYKGAKGRKVLSALYEAGNGQGTRPSNAEAALVEAVRLRLGA